MPNVVSYTQANLVIGKLVRRDMIDKATEHNTHKKGSGRKEAAMMRRVIWPCVLLMAIVSTVSIMIFYTPVQIVASVVYANDNSTAHTDPTVKGCTNRICSQKQRFQLLRSHCEKNPQLKGSYDEEDSHTYYRLLVDDKHKLLYCALPKAASTTFYNMFYYSYTGKFLEDIHCRQCWEDQGIVFLSHFSKSERDKRLRDYYKIM
ncbi:hypothetical protein CAPTEDRAFT_216122, partial [Capitella teleta]